MARFHNDSGVSSQGWDNVATWYAGWVGKHGSIHHRQTILPALIELLAPRAGENILDVGCGPGVPAPHVAAAGARYTGIDRSTRLIGIARRHHGRCGRFVVADATRLGETPEVGRAAFDAATFVMSIQDIAPLDAALRSTAASLRETARIVIVMTHPCFRVPRQSGWGRDGERGLQFRRIDRYLSPLAVPMRSRSLRHRSTVSHHRPLEAYVNGLAAEGFAVDAIREIAVSEAIGGAPATKSERAAFREIPLFLAMRAARR